MFTSNYILHSILYFVTAKGQVKLAASEGLSCLYFLKIGVDWPFACRGAHTLWPENPFSDKNAC